MERRGLKGSTTGESRKSWDKFQFGEVERVQEPFEFVGPVHQFGIVKYVIVSGGLLHRLDIHEFTDNNIGHEIRSWVESVNNSELKVQSACQGENILKYVVI